MTFNFLVKSSRYLGYEDNEISHHISFITHVLVFFLFFPKKKSHGCVKTGTERQLKRNHYFMVSCLWGEFQLHMDMVERKVSLWNREKFFLEHMNHWTETSIMYWYYKPYQVKNKNRAFIYTNVEKQMPLKSLSDWEFNWTIPTYFILVITVCQVVSLFFEISFVLTNKSEPAFLIFRKLLQQ